MNYREKPCPFCGSDERLNMIVGRFGWVHSDCWENAGDVDPDEDSCFGKLATRTPVGVR